MIIIKRFRKTQKIKNCKLKKKITYKKKSDEQSK